MTGSNRSQSGPSLRFCSCEFSQESVRQNTFGIEPAHKLLTCLGVHIDVEKSLSSSAIEIEVKTKNG